MHRSPGPARGQSGEAVWQGRAGPAPPGATGGPPGPVAPPGRQRAGRGAAL